jgi:two-component system response regulator VicR
MTYSILFVDDEKNLVRTAEIYLTRSGYEFHAAYDGIEALEKLDHFTPDLIILDIAMPRLNGWDVLRLLQQDPVKAQIPVLLLTAHSHDAEKARGWELGATWFHTKPFSFDELLLVIERILQAGDEDRSTSD